MQIRDDGSSNKKGLSEAIDTTEHKYFSVNTPPIQPPTGHSNLQLLKQL
jgi:hypothetical protein